MLRPAAPRGQAGDRFRELGGDPEVLLPLVAAAPDYLEAALAEMREAYGTVEGYFDDGLGIDAAGQAALRTSFVEHR